MEYSIIENYDARKFIHGHHLFLEAYSFHRVSLSENLLYIDSYHIYRSKQTAKKN